MLKGFKDFIMRGNVVDLAVAVVIGAAFTALVSAFTDTLIQPVLASVGGVDASGWGVQLVDGNDATFMDFGALVTAVITFIVTAAVVYFVFVVPINKARELQRRRAGIEEEPEVTGPTDTELLAEIRDLLRARDTQG